MSMTAPAQLSAMFRRIILAGAVLTFGLAGIGGVIGYFVASWPGLVSVLVGAVMAFIFLTLTVVSIVIANRFWASPLFSALFFAIVLGGWLLKFVLFIVVIVVLKNQEWLNSFVLYLTVIVGVIATLVLDVVLVVKARIPYVADSAPVFASREENR